MVAAFAPQFFLLLGIDIFLGGGIVTIMLDNHFPAVFPYMLELGAFVGFGQLLAGPYYISGFSSVFQFYCCFTYCMIAVLSVVGGNLLLLFARRNLSLSGLFAISATLPSALSSLFFASAYVNGVSLNLPLLPNLPITWIYLIFIVTAALLVALIMGAAYHQGKNT